MNQQHQPAVESSQAGVVRLPMSFPRSRTFTPPGHTSHQHVSSSCRHSPIRCQVIKASLLTCCWQILLLQIKALPTSTWCHDLLLLCCLIFCRTVCQRPTVWQRCSVAAVQRMFPGWQQRTTMTDLVLRAMQSILQNSPQTVPCAQ